MKKLTTVSLMCRRCVVMAFIELPLINGKPILYGYVIDTLFKEHFGFTPTAGETISFL